MNYKKQPIVHKYAPIEETPSEMAGGQSKGSSTC